MPKNRHFRNGKRRPKTGLHRGEKMKNPDGVPKWIPIVLNDGTPAIELPDGQVFVEVEEK